MRPFAEPGHRKSQEIGVRLGELLAITCEVLHGGMGVSEVLLYHIAMAES